MRANDHRITDMYAIIIPRHGVQTHVDSRSVYRLKQPTIARKPVGELG